MSIIILLLFIFTIQKEVKENVKLDFELLSLSSSYDYRIYTFDTSKIKKTIYFIIETELNTLPFDICYSIRGSTDKKNISIYHQEQKGNLIAFFFKIEKPDTSFMIIDFNVSNINSRYALLGRSDFEEINANIIHIEDAIKENKIQIIKNKPLLLLFNTENLGRKSVQITVSSFNCFKKRIQIFGSNKYMNETFILGRDWHFWLNTFILYDNKTYELYQDYGDIGLKAYKSVFYVFEPLIDDNITFQFKNISKLVYNDISQKEIGSSFFENIIYKKILYLFKCSNYYQDLFYFTMKKFKQYSFKYFYSNENNNLDVPSSFELKKVTCKSKNNYEYCEMNRTSLEQKIFYLIVENEAIESNMIDIRSTFFNEYNYTIQEPYSSYEYRLNSNKKPNLPIVIGDFEYSEKFYLEIEIDFPEQYPNNDDKDNNIKHININAKILNQKAESYLELSLENKDMSLIRNFATEIKSYYLYESKDKFTSGVKSLFFFVNHKGKNPNCNIKYGTYKEKPIKYENNLMFINQEKSFNNTYEIFFLSVNLTRTSFLSDDNIYLDFKSKKEAFVSNIINYKLDTSKANYNINGNYSVCGGEIKEEGEEKIISCFIPIKSAKSLNIILYLKKNYEINVKTELIYRGNFVDSLSLSPDRKYIISNNASDNDNHYLFISKNNDFNIEDISYNTIDNLDNFTESYPIEDKKEIFGFVDKRIYININNKDNKSFIGFKTGNISIPFKIIKTKFDESNIHFINFIETFRFNLAKNSPLFLY